MESLALRYIKSWLNLPRSFTTSALHHPDLIDIPSDLSGWRASENPVGTIPEELLVTTARPDIVLVKNSAITMIELTVPHNAQESMLKAKTFKSQKENYQKVLSDFDARRVSAELYTIEIGSLGHWLPCSRKSLLQSFPTLKKSTASSILDRAGMRVVGASQTNFKSRNDPTWHSSRPLL